MSKILELQKRREDVFRNMQTLRGKATETGQMPADYEAQWAAMDADWQSLTTQIQQESLMLERQRELDGAAAERQERNQHQERRGAAAVSNYEEVFWRYIGRGFQELSREDREVLKAGYVAGAEKRGTSTQITTSNTLGGYANPELFLAEIVKTMAYFGPMLEICRVLETDGGNSMKIPTVDDTGTSANQQTTEGAAITVQDITFGGGTIGAWTYATTIKISEQELQDEAVGLSSFIGMLAGERIGRKVNNVLTLGDASSKPQGIITGASLGKTAASATAFTVNELVDLLHSVNAAYRRDPSCAWQFNDATAGTIRKLAIGSGDARGLWEPDLKMDRPDRLLGFPIYINNDMASALTTGQKLVLFGAHSRYLIRKVRNFVSKRLDERYADELAVGFVTGTRLDGKVLDSAALKYLALA